MVPVADHEDINVMPFTKLVDALHDVVRFLRFAVNRDIPLFADFLRSPVSPVVRHLQQRGVSYLAVLLARSTIVMLQGDAAGGIHHARLHRMQQVHLPAALPYEVCSKVHHGAPVIGKICRDQYP